MAIIIEGMDNSGKSTLAVRLADYMGLIVQESEGPPRTEDEINERVDKYAEMEGRLFVRHPVVSNAIYDQARSEDMKMPVSIGRQMLFYDAKHTFIYCDAGNRGLGGHIEKSTDTPQHLADITNHYNKLLYLYRQWAAEHAHFVYRIGDDVDQLISTIYFHHCYSVA